MPANRFHFERSLLAEGLTRIAGVDEAGRGPLAGPVVAAAVVFPEHWIREGLPPHLEGLNDSKQLTEARREQFFEALTAESGVLQAVAVVEAATIDAINILRATHQAMTAALARLQPSPEHVLVDGLRVDAIGPAHTPIVKGDARSYSIAAASILAKVTRDRLMLAYDRAFPGYGFAKHKGYGTPQHLEAMARLGPCPIHRRSFAPLSQPELDLFGT